jgi:GNAT superfamily N-acetyltransferase
MNDTLDTLATLERANYQAMRGLAQVTPGVDLVLRDDLILTGSDSFPAPDTTHACLLQATPQTADGLLDEIVAYFGSRGLPATVFVSPACAPSDWAERLLKRGFVQQETAEAWLVLGDLAHVHIPPALSKVAVKPVARHAAATFARIFLAAFEMPVELAPFLTQLLEPGMHLPGVYHYLAYLDGQPVGTASLLCYQRFGVLGSVGVLPQHRRSGAAGNLAIRAAADARRQGVDTLMLQTAAGARLERLLRMSGFKRVFTRTCFTLP